VSDAGTPGVSDPGVLLVARASYAGALVEANPGPSAVTAAISVAGLTGNQFSFLGFVPQKKGRKTFFEHLSVFNHPVVFFESTHRILKTLDALTELTHAPHIIVARELTKLYEEVVRGDADTVRAHFLETPATQKGEFVIIVAPSQNTV